MKRKGAKMRKGSTIRVEIVYVPKSEWPKEVLEAFAKLRKKKR